MADMSIKDCRELFDYDPITGRLFWKRRSAGSFKTNAAAKIWNARFAGKLAGCEGEKSSERYLLVNYRKKTFRAHRIIWAIVYGELPEIVDHINGDIRDNRIANLRNVTNAENCRNQKRRKTNVSGVTGVRRRYGAWRAEIFVSGTRYQLGKFDDLASAMQARKAAEERFGFHRNHGRESR